MYILLINENYPLHFAYPSNIIGIELVGNELVGYNIIKSINSELITDILKLTKYRIKIKRKFEVLICLVIYWILTICKFM